MTTLNLPKRCSLDVKTFTVPLQDCSKIIKKRLLEFQNFLRRLRGLFKSTKKGSLHPGIFTTPAGAFQNYQKRSFVPCISCYLLIKLTAKNKYVESNKMFHLLVRFDLKVKEMKRKKFQTSKHFFSCLQSKNHS